MGAFIQMRALGGVVGFTTATNLLNTHITSNLAGVLSHSQLALVLEVVQNIRLLLTEQ